MSSFSSFLYMKHEERKQIPVYSGFIKYFPRAIRAVAKVSQTGNDQHNPGQPLHWDEDKSTDHEDALARHLVDHAQGEEFDEDQERHLAKVAWRAMSALETFLKKNK